MCACKFYEVHDHSYIHSRQTHDTHSRNTITKDLIGVTEKRLIDAFLRCFGL